MLAFNPPKSRHYKLVALIYEELSNSYSFHNYSSENNTWIKSRETGDVTFGLGGYWDDAVIWYDICSASFFMFDIFQDHLSHRLSMDVMLLLIFYIIIILGTAKGI